MKTLTCVGLLVSIAVVLGCAPPKLNWGKTAKQQHLKTGDIIKVEGLCYDLAKYKVAQTKSGKLIEDYEKNELVWIKQEFPGVASKLKFWLFDPKSVVNEDMNPLAPIGVVICTVFNPSYYENFKELTYLYPYERVNSDPRIEHRVEFTGEVQGFGKEELRLANKPVQHLNCIYLNVEDIKVISSQPYTLTEKRP